MGVRYGIRGSRKFSDRLWIQSLGGSALDVSGATPVALIHSFGVQCPNVGVCCVREKPDCRPLPILTFLREGPPRSET